MKVVDLALQTKYRKEYDYCEVCAKFHVVYPVRDGLELHHLLGGDDRTDEWWNFVRLCQAHHRRVTPHHSEGKNHRELTINLFALKFLKGEYDKKVLLSLGIWDKIAHEVSVLRESEGYKLGLKFGWYER